MAEVDLEQRHRLEASLWDEYVVRHKAGENLTVVVFPPEQAAADLRWALETLSDVWGKTILDCGCGTGDSAVFLALMGARVCGFDISPKSIEIAKRRAEYNGVTDRTEFRVMAGEQLEYEDESFDIIFGKSVLHHLVLPLAASEIQRVLKPGGYGVFLEPQGTNPFLRFVRACVPYPGKKRHGTDRPFTVRDIEILRRHFAAVDYRSFQLLGGLERLLGRRMARLQRVDERLLKCLPWLWPMCVRMGVRVQKSTSASRPPNPVSPVEAAEPSYR